MDYLYTDRAPTPLGHYSQATRHDGHLYISGQLPIRIDDEGHAHAARATFRAQATQALTNVLTILADAGGTPSNLVQVTAYIVGVKNWPTFNEVYAELLGAARPARAVVPVPELHCGFLIEIEAVAVRLGAGAP